MNDTAEGGCLCGAVRYRVSGEPAATTLCHCRSCRRASGGTNVAWAVFDHSAFEWLSGYPGAYSSSPGIEWLFCRDCGSLVGYRRSSRPDHMDITTGTLDDPNLYSKDRKKFDAASASIAKAQEELAAAEDRWLELEVLREEIEQA